MVTEEEIFEYQKKLSILQQCQEPCVRILAHKKNKQTNKQTNKNKKQKKPTKKTKHNIYNCLFKEMDMGMFPVFVLCSCIRCSMLYMYIPLACILWFLSVGLVVHWGVVLTDDGRVKRFFYRFEDVLTSNWPSESRISSRDPLMGASGCRYRHVIAWRKIRQQTSKPIDRVHFSFDGLLQGRLLISFSVI